MSTERMKFSNRLLMVITPIGVAIGLYEAWHLAGKLVFLMALQDTGAGHHRSRDSPHRAA